MGGLTGVLTIGVVGMALSISNFPKPKEVMVSVRELMMESIQSNVYLGPCQRIQQAHASVRIVKVQLPNQILGSKHVVKPLFHDIVRMQVWRASASHANGAFIATKYCHKGISTQT